MYNGPIVNVHSEKELNRDPLGISGVSYTIVNDISPIISSVTPYAFYWIYLNWIYYDYYEIRQLDLNSKIEFDEYKKVMNFFMVLGNRLNGINYNSMLGNNYFNSINLEDELSYSYNESYVKSMTTINYYRGALMTAGFFDKKNIFNDRLFYYDKGINLGKSIHSLIKNTVFYNEHVLKNNYVNVPANVIKEFASIASFKMEKLSESKKMLREYFFDDNEKLKIQEKFIKHFYYDVKIKEIDDNVVRKYLCNYYSPRWDNNRVGDDLYLDFRSWEVLVNRHYFVVALYRLFNCFVKNIEEINYNQYIEKLIKTIPDIRVDDFLKSNVLRVEQMDDIIHNKSLSPDIIIDSFKIIFTIYYSLNKRNDINKKYLSYNNYNTSISIMKMIRDIDRFKDRKLKEYAYYVFEEYIIKQHIKTAQRKLMDGKNNFFFTVSDDYLYKVKELNRITYLQGLRIKQIFMVMKALDMLGD